MRIIVTIHGKHLAVLSTSFVTLTKLLQLLIHANPISYETRYSSVIKEQDFHSFGIHVFPRFANKGAHC